MSDAGMTCDVLVVGAGPGGIAAAVTAAECGSRVVVVDDNPHAGGQIWRNRGNAPRLHGAAQWLSRFSRSHGITLLAGSRIVSALGANALLADTPGGPQVVRYTSLILATGARELFLPFPGWTLPGIMGVGGIQALAKSGLDVRGKRVVVAGSGPLLLAVAALLRSHGAIVPMVVEQASAAAIRRFGLALFSSPSKLFSALSMCMRLKGTPYATGSYVTRAITGAALQVSVQHGVRESSIACDYLACGFGLVPNNELPQILGCAVTHEGFVTVNSRLETTRASIFAVGELMGIGGVEKAVIEGRMAALAASGKDPAMLARVHARSLIFADRLKETFYLRPELFALAEPDTIVCRCEDVPFAVATRCLSARDSKLQTRCGMGACQGRICGAILERVIGAEPAIVRPPIFPTAIATLSGSERR